MAEPPLITFYSGERTFERLLTGDTLDALKATARSKLGLPATQPLQLTQLRKKRRIDLDDEHDFAAFVRRARQDGGIEVEVTVPGEPEEHPDAPPRKKQRTDAHQPTLPGAQPLRLPDPPPPPLSILPTPASSLDTIQKTLPLLPPVEITPAASTSAAPAAAAEPVKAKPGRKRKQVNAEEPAAPADGKRRKTKGAAAVPDGGAVNDTAVKPTEETSGQGASAGAAGEASNSKNTHGASSSNAAADDLQAALREYNERKRATRTAADIWQKHVATKQENEAKKKAARRRSGSVSSASASAHEEEPPADNAAKAPRAKNARPKDKDKEKDRAKEAELAPAPAPEPVAATANEAPDPKAHKARWKNRPPEPEPEPAPAPAPVEDSNNAASTSTAAEAPAPAPAPAAPAIGDAAAVAPEGATTAEALAKALALAHSDAPAAASSSPQQQQQQQPPKGDRYRLVPCPICGLRPFHLRYECSVLKAGEPAVRARLEGARAKGELVVVGELERWLKRVAEKKAREDAEAGKEKEDRMEVDEQPKEAPSSSDDDDSSSSEDEDESAKSELLTQPKPLSKLDTVDLDALIRGPGPKRASLVALIPDKSDDEEDAAEKDSQPEPEPEPAPADGEDDEDARRLRAIERRISRGGRATQQILAHSSSESSDSSEDDDNAGARSFADLNGPASSQFQAAYRAGDAALSAIAAAERRLSPSVLRHTAADVLVEASEAEAEVEEEDSSATRVLTPPPPPLTQDQVSPITSFSQTPRRGVEMVVQMDTPRRLTTYGKHRRTPVQKAPEPAEEEEEEEEEEEQPPAKKSSPPPEKQPPPLKKQKQKQPPQEEKEEEEEEEEEAPPGPAAKEKTPAAANARRKLAADKDAKPKGKTAKGKDKDEDQRNEDESDEEPVKRGRASSVPARSAAAKRETLKKKLGGASDAEGDAASKKKKRSSSAGPGRPRLSDAVKAERAEAKEAERKRKAADKARAKAEREAEQQAKKRERERVKAEKDAAKAAKAGKGTGAGKKAAASKKAAAAAQDDAQPVASTSASATQESEGKKSRMSLPGWTTVPLETSSPRGASSGVDQLESSQSSPVVAAFTQAQAQTQPPVASPHISSVDDVGEVDDALNLGEDTPRPRAAASSPGKTLRPSSPVDKPTFLSQRPKLASSARRSDTRGITGLSSFTLSPMQPPKTRPKTPATGKKNAFREAEELAQIGEDDDSDDDSDAQTKKPATAAYAQIPAKHRKAGVGVGRVSSPRKR